MSTKLEPLRAYRKRLEKWQIKCGVEVYSVVFGFCATRPKNHWEYSYHGTTKLEAMNRLAKSLDLPAVPKRKGKKK